MSCLGRLNAICGAVERAGRLYIILTPPVCVKKVAGKWTESDIASPAIATASEAATS